MSITVTGTVMVPLDKKTSYNLKRLTLESQNIRHKLNVKTKFLLCPNNQFKVHYFQVKDSFMKKGLDLKTWCSNLTVVNDLLYIYVYYSNFIY